RALVAAAAGAATRPRVLVSASAVGYYGPRGDEPLDESADAGTGFLADVCRAWEREALAAEPLGLRVVRLRLGIVLANDGGALARMLPPFRFFAGGPIGSGEQWMSWVHRDDVTGLVVDALEKDAYSGAVNATTPHPATNSDFAAALGRALARPAVLRTPAFALRLALGEMADMLLTGQRVLPRVAEAHGYYWRYPELPAALRASARL
ncbi:MAG TPA: TIGR01777 family oxidoreductase, partial [Candidatus Binatia bacterium]|nr:TIGR01777 family oxidoreductase [Candidatus Binatia bacterium]